MAQDVVLTAAKPLSSRSQQERLTLFAELDGEPICYPTSREKMLTLGTEAEVTAALKWMLRPERPCAPERIVTYLTALAVTHPMQGLPPEAASLKFRIFCEDLGHIPESIIAEACRLYRRDPANTFFPTPGKMLAICEPMMKARDLRRLGAEKMLRTLSEPEHQPEPFKGPYSVPEQRIVTLTEERKAELEAVLNRFRKPQEIERTPSKPAEREHVDARGALSPERRAELRALRENLLTRSRSAAA